MAKTTTDTAAELERAQTEAERAADTVRTWEARAQEARHELSAAEQTAGADALKSGDPEAAAARIGELRDRVEVLERTVEAAREALAEAERARKLADAADRRRQADDIDAQAGEHEQRRDELLDALQQHEGCRFVVDRPEAGVATARQFYTPHSEQLRHQAQALRRQAADLEREAAVASKPAEQTAEV